MDLLDRYLQAVKKHLPWKRQDDIIAELKANLESQLEEKEAELGRPLTRGEAEDWLREMGSPLKVAAGYQRQQYLIGPAVFPTFWFVLRMAWFWVTVAFVIGHAVQFATSSQGWSGLWDAVILLPIVLMMTAGWVTLTFAIIEFTAAHSSKRWGANPAASAGWNPSSLPPVDQGAAPGKGPRSHGRAVAEVALGFLWLVLLLLIPWQPYVLLGPGAAYLLNSPFQLGPVLIQVFWWIVALNVLQVGWRLADLWRGSWHEARTAQEIAVKAVGLIPPMLVLYARDHFYVLLKHPLVDQARYGATLESINRSIYWTAAVICIIVALQLAWELWRLGMNTHRRRLAASV
jgi:hypothetical protein